MAARTFLITGSSSGFGLQLVLVALNAGHKVLAAVRDTIRASIEHPMVEQLGGRWVKIDVNDKDTESVVQKLVRENKVDLLVNNAGYAILGALEAMSVDEFEAQIQTNTIGSLRCIKGALPFFREQGRGTIVNISSSAGFYAAPACAAYAASKFALEAISEALAREVGVFGIRVLLIEPGAFRTNLNSSMKVPAMNISDYEGTPANELVKAQLVRSGQQPGDPYKGAMKIVEVATDAAGELLAKKGRGEVLRVFLGNDCFEAAKANIGKFEENLNMLEEIAKSTDFEG